MNGYETLDGLGQLPAWGFYNLVSFEETYADVNNIPPWLRSYYDLMLPLT